MLKVTGLDKVQRELEAVQKALSTVSDEMNSVSFHAHDPASIDAAIQEMERLVDARLGSSATNSITMAVAQSLKEKYRQMLLDKAAEARAREDA